MLDSVSARTEASLRVKRGALKKVLAKTFPLAALCVLMMANSATAQTQVRANITADNAYSFGYGSGVINTLYGPVENTDPKDIFNCPKGRETYTFTPAPNDYLYIIAWSDDSGLQGVLGEFLKAGLHADYSHAIYTGTPDWQVYATGMDVDIGKGGVSLAQINAQLAIADTPGAGGPASSGGWVDINGGIPGTTGTTGTLVIGGANTKPPSALPFPHVCGISRGARWMWYNAYPGVLDGFTQNPNDGHGHREFLIFRIPVKKVLEDTDPIEPGPIGTGKIDPNDVIVQLAPCSLAGDISHHCDLGQDAQGNRVYAFTAPVSLPGGESCDLSVEMPPEATNVTYGPTTMTNGSAQVSGTFTLPPSRSGPFCFEIKCKTAMTSCSKTVCTQLLPLARVADDHSHQDTTADGGRAGAAKLAVGGQVSSLNTRQNTRTAPGFGGWVDYRLSRAFAVGGEVNFFPREDPFNDLGGGRVTQAFVTGSVGRQFDGFRLYGKVGPGLNSFSRKINGLIFDGELVSAVDVGRKNLFALKFGGGVEMCPSSRFFTSIEAGDVATWQQSHLRSVSLRPGNVSTFWEHNLQFGFRFGGRF